MIGWGRFKEYFEFNRKEQRGLMVIGVLFLGLVGWSSFEGQVQQKDGLDVAMFSNQIDSFERAILKEDSLKWKQKGWRTAGSERFMDSANLRYLKREETFFIDINHADTLDFQRLKGIGPGYARRIVNYRDRLGGFIAKEQLLEVFGMDSIRYQLIAEHLAVGSDSIRGIDLNHVTFKELMRHPYFPFVIAKAIITYRTALKRFSSLEELKKIDVVSDSIFRKITPYVIIR